MPSDITPATQRIRDDIDPAKTWVVSDTHFGHENIVAFCHRPEDHDQLMIAEWRAHVPDDATLLHLGDLCYRGNGYFKHIIAPELTGKRKILIKGNHDRKNYGFYRDCDFKLARPFTILYGGREVPEAARDAREQTVIDGRFFDREPYRVSFSHYPWNDAEDGRPISTRDLRLHGHIHNNGYTRDGYVPFLKQHINLSIEQTKYRPVNLKLLLDAALLGTYPETTQEQLDDARDRKAENMQSKS